MKELFGLWEPVGSLEHAVHAGRTLPTRATQAPGAHSSGHSEA
jgi:hypothetical protein